MPKFYTSSKKGLPSSFRQSVPNSSKTSAIAILQLNDEEKAIMEEISGNIILAIKNGIEKITEELKEKSDFQDAIRDYDRYMLNSNFIENK